VTTEFGASDFSNETQLTTASPVELQPRIQNNYARRIASSAKSFEYLIESLAFTAPWTASCAPFITVHHGQDNRLALGGRCNSLIATRAVSSSLG